MRQTREQRMIELLQTSTTNQTADSLVHAIIRNTSAAWAWFWFGIVGWLIAGSNQQDETGFAMIDEGKIYFYKVTGLGKRQTIEGRREIAFNQIEKVRRTRGGRTSPAALNISWRNNNNKRMELVLGAARVKQFPNQQANINEMTQLILANNIEIKPNHSVRNTLLAVLIGIPLFFLFIVLLALAY